jgi:hypothetical protein
VILSPKYITCHRSLCLQSSVTLFAQRQQLTAQRSALPMRQLLLHICNACVRDACSDTTSSSVLLLTVMNSMEHSPSYEPNSRSAGRKTPCLAYSPSFVKAVTKAFFFSIFILPSTAGPVSFYGFMIHFNIIFPYMPRYPKSSPTFIFVAIYFSSPMHATFSMLVTLLSVVVLMIFDARRH